MDKHSALDAPRILSLSIMTTIVAAIVGVLIVMVALGPISLFALLILPVALPYLAVGLVMSFVFAAPLTLILFPLISTVLKSYPIAALVIMPFVGLFGGGGIMYLWTLGLAPYDNLSKELLQGAGIVSGFISGAFFGRGLNP